MLELHFSTGGPGLRFVSTSAEQITVAVNHVMSRWKLSQPVFVFFFFFFFFLCSSKILQYILHLHPTILSNYYTNYTNTTGTGPQGAKDNDYPVAINIKTRK